MRSTPRVLGFASLTAIGVSIATIAAGEGEARAELPKYEFADGPTACHAFDAKNERELAEFSKTQPATPYQYPREDTILGAPWGPFVSGIGDSLDLLAASAVPHFGAQLRAENPAVVVSWPWSLPFGPAFTCSRKQGTFTVRNFKSHRILLEPGLVGSKVGAGFFTRPGYRFLYHPSDWVVGAGGGLGTTVELSGNREPTRMSLSPEAVIQFGHCCDSSYFTLAVRYDRFFAGTNLNIVWGSLGYTFF